NILNNNGESAQVTKGNRLAFQGDRHFEYDDRGNLIREKRGKGGQLTTEFEYNDQNQLTKVTKGKQETAYQYDPLGRRISKKDNFGETRFLWNGNQLLSESRGEINKTYLFEPGGFRPLAFVQDQKVYHYHVDHLGTPQEISNEQGEIVWSVQYRAYGNVVKKEIEQIENNLRFQGQYFDEETGLHYNRFRYYNPTTGRFINQDPIGLLGGMNNYQYAPNPTGWVDPFGLTCKLAKKIQEKANKGNIREITQGKVCEKGYHGRLTKERMLEIVREPDGVYISTEGYQNVIFAKDGDIVVFAGDKAGAFKGQAITSYGPSGPRGESGSVIHGGSPNDSGLPITEEMIVNGQIPTPSGGFLAPANKIFI
ncbi:MAG: sugar-binding protein, partial [Gammaproteobacteria bacterium]